MQINQHAPIVASHEIEVFAPPDKVWDWLSRVEMWQSWRQDVSSAYWVEGAGTEGVIKWRLKKLLGFTAHVTVWREQREMGWYATSYGSQLTQVLQISGDYRKSFVTSRLSLHGGLTRFRPTRMMIDNMLNRSMEIWLGALKTKLEAGKDDFMSPPPNTDNPFENNVQLPSQKLDIRP